MRNEYFQGGLSPKTITSVQKGNDACCIFEGFMDWLSCLTLLHKRNLDVPDIYRWDYIILNSVANVSKAINSIGNYRKIYTCLDNDEGGRKATRLIQSANPTVCDCSARYAEYKDLNDYLCGKKQVQEKKQNRGMRI